MNIDKIVSELEKIGVIGSPSSTTELSLDILGSAVEKKLVGELAFFKYQQEGRDNYSLGQITEVELRNAWLEDPTMRSLARHKGHVNPISGQQDTHLGKMTLSAVFANTKKEFEPSILGTVPQTGTPILMANDQIINALLAKYQDEIFYLGNVYGSKPKLPLWFKHFDKGSNGAGEAYHLGVFGKTGSGKSVLAKMTLTAYMRYSKMAIVIVDPQGEFARDFNGSGSGEFNIPLSDIAKGFNKTHVAISVKNLVLDRWELFKEILYESLFFERLSIPRGENREIACDILQEKLRKAKINLGKLHEKDSFDSAWKILADTTVQTVFYRTPGSRDRFSAMLASADQEEFFEQYWKPVAELFRSDRTGARSVEKALSWLLAIEKDGKTVDNRPILIIDLSKEQADGLFWNDKIQALVIKRVLNGLTGTAEFFFKGGKNLNTLVIIDEAHRLAPRDTPTDETEKSVRNV